MTQTFPRAAIEWPTCHSNNTGITLSIIIVSWNTRSLLEDCLRSLEQELTAVDPTLAETIVVDNASTDGTAAMLQDKFPWVYRIENAQNPGFAAANNQAIDQSNGDYVFLLNPDTRLYPGALLALLDFMDKHPRAGAVGSRLLNPDGSLQPSCSPAPTLARELWRLLHLDALYPLAVYPMHAWPLDRPRRVEVVQGAAMLVRRTTLNQVGRLDPDYYIYSEEVDLCQRMRRAGWEIYWLPQSQVIHYGGQSTQQRARAMFLHLYGSKILYFRKHQGRRAAHFYKWLLYLAAIARLTLTPLIALQSGQQRARSAALAGHYRQLLRDLPRM